MMYSGGPMESVLYQDAEGVAVTTTRFQVGASMYPIRGITAVAAGFWSQPGSKGVAWIFMVLALVSIASAAESPRGALILGAIFVALAIVSAARAKPIVWHTVMVHTGGMQQTAVTTKDQARRDAIVRALHQATSGA